MSDLEGLRDVPPCPGRAAVEYRPLPGWPRYVVGSDRSVWLDRERPGQAAADRSPRWRRLADRRISGRSGYVELWHGGRAYMRTVELLHRAAFASAELRAGWSRRIGPGAGPRRLAHLAEVPIPPPAEFAPAPHCPTPETGRGPASTFPTRHVEYRPVPGFPGYEMGDDRCVWATSAGGRRVRRLREDPDADGNSCVVLAAAGGRHRLTLEDLMRATFPECAPPADDGRPATVEYRPVPGFPGYELGSDRSLWSCAHDHPRTLLGLPAPWIPAPRNARQAGWTPIVVLGRDGRWHSRSLDKLMRQVFAPVVPRGYPGPDECARGSRHGRARLDEAKVIEARRLKRAGWTYPALVARYGVGKVTLFYAITGETWRHVPMEAP